MMFFENLSLALAALKANKMRAFLTMLGIIIGIGSVITIMTLGDSLTSSVTDSMQSMGANNVMVSLQQKSDEEEDEESGMSFGSTTGSVVPGEADYFTDEMLDALRDTYGDEMLGISLTESVGSGRAEDGKLYANVSATGVNFDYFVANETTILSGRMFSVKDMLEGKKVALVSDKLVNNLFAGDAGSAIGSTVEVALGGNYYSYTIIGVYEYEQSTFVMSTTSDKDTITSLYIPLDAARDQLHSADGYQGFTVVTAEGVDSTQFASRVERFMNTYYRTNQNFEVSAFSMESIVSQFTSLMGTLNIAVAVIAGISLLVGGIGVMNIMLVSITERTREIGTCKALGATNSAIRSQFIIEAVIICLIGGIVGIVLGITAGALGSNALGFPVKASVQSIVIALTFSSAIGIFFGYYPRQQGGKDEPHRGSEIRIGETKHACTRGTGRGAL